MEDKKNVKSKIWIYAVVLFTSAFIVLLFANYSQIKLNKNLADYKNQISSQKNEKKKIQLSFASEQEINAKLTDENKKLEEEKNSLSENITELEKELSALNEKTVKQIDEYGKFSTAQSEYFNGNIVNSAQLMKNIDVSQYDASTTALFNTFFSKVSDEAYKLLYDEGYRLYKQGKYYEAAENLTASRNISVKGEYSDNCLYYLAKTEYKLKLKQDAVNHMKELLIEYPDSQFYKSAKTFVQKYGG